MLFIFQLLLAVFVSVSGAWAYCYNSMSSQPVKQDCGCHSYYCGNNPTGTLCQEYQGCSGYPSDFDPSLDKGGDKCVVVGEGSCSSDMSNYCGIYGSCVGQSLQLPITCCTSQCEADSVQCVNDGGRWEYNGGATCGGMYCNTMQCDTTFNCIEYPFNRCEDVPSSGSVECDENGVRVSLTLGGILNCGLNVKMSVANILLIV